MLLLLAALVIAAGVGEAIFLHSARPRAAKPPPVAAAPPPPPTVAVTVSLPGASAQTSNSFIAAALTKALAQIPDITCLETLATPNQCTAILRFDPTDDLPSALQKTQKALAGINDQLPVTSGHPQIRPGDPAALPRLWLTLTSDHSTLADLTTLARRQIINDLERLPGITDVTMIGSAEEVPTLTIDPAAMTALDLDVPQVLHALATAPKTMPTTSPAWQDTILATRNNAPIRLRDIAKLSNELHTTGTAAINETPTILLAVTANSDHPTPAEIRQQIQQLASTLPPDTHLDLRADLATDDAILIESHAADRSPQATADLLQKLSQTAAHLAPSSTRIAFSTPETPGKSTLLLIDTDHPLAPADLRKALAPIADTRVQRIAHGAIPAVQFVLLGHDPVLLKKWAQTSKSRLESTPDAPQVDLFPGDDTPALQMNIDSVAASKLGLTIDDVSDLITLASAELPLTLPDGQQIHLRFAGNHHLSPETINSLTIKSPSGDTFPLSALVTLTTTSEPTGIARVDFFPAVLLTIYLPDAATPESIQTKSLAILNAQHDTLHLPATYHVTTLP